MKLNIIINWDSISSLRMKTAIYSLNIMHASIHPRVRDAYFPEQNDQMGNI
jgi:hypothetical protein